MAKLIDENGLAEWLGISVTTLRRTRCCNPERHPPYKKLGSAVRYDPVEIQKWLDSRTVNRLFDVPAPSSKSQVEDIDTQNTTKRGAPTKIERVKKAKNASK